MPNREINKRIASLRKLREYKQSDVAELLKIKVSTYSQMERKGIITGEMILKLAEVFDVDPREILCGEKAEMPPPEPPKTPEPLEIKLTNSESNIIKIYRNLNKEKREEVFDSISRIAKLGKYKNA